MRESRITP